MKVNFTRKPTPEEIYPQTEAVIEKTVRLTKEEFEEQRKAKVSKRGAFKEKIYLEYVE